ncbi:TM2 domain-containing protein [Lactococcus garvieae]|uniref:TM2 domain-containing protein n=1 Tax=Lactococcus garvieae TaxID=1363 RepID=UPI00254C1275|nr:TM2 domain-containing protein [Lactococcus garvieae]
MNEKKINKHIFVWIGNFLVGGLGVDRFMRGQIGMGIFKLLCNWMTLGIWSLIDWIISMVKAYSTYSDTDDITFINGKYSK